MALIDIEVLRSDDTSRSATLQRAVSWLGPPDGTVVLTLESGQEFSDELVDEVVDTFGQYGEIILVRFVIFMYSFNRKCTYINACMKNNEMEDIVEAGYCWSKVLLPTCPCWFI